MGFGAAEATSLFDYCYQPSCAGCHPTGLILGRVVLFLNFPILTPPPQELKSALLTVGVSAEEVNAIFDVVAAVLHLTDLSFISGLHGTLC